MMQEDSNGESTFEFVEKKDEMSASSDTTKSDSTSVSRSSPLLAQQVSSPVAPNILSTVAPPSALPSFVPSIDTTLTKVKNVTPSPEISFTSSSSESWNSPVTIPPVESPSPAFHPTMFSPVIPASKGGDSPSVTEQYTTDSSGNGGLLNWVKGAVGSSTGLLSKVAEKAKSSVDSMITTLDPQMKDFLHSGGDIHIVVASDKEVKVSPVREAFQSTFGKATVVGVAAQASYIAAQPVGFSAALRAAEERLGNARSINSLHPQVPVIAVENFLVEVGEDKWYDVGLLLLNDLSREITLQLYTQMVPVPSAVVTVARDETPNDYPLRETGFSVTIGSLMARNLQVHHSEWHQALTGVSRREMLLMAARSLAGMYKTCIGKNS